MKLKNFQFILLLFYSIIVLLVFYFILFEIGISQITDISYIKENHNLYTIYKNTYISRIENNEPDEYTNIYSDDQLVTLTEYYKRNTEISVLLFVLTYTLNIIDASVNAHLFEYNISEELSIKIRPTYLEKENIGGLSLLIKL